MQEPTPSKPHRHFILHKPFGYLSQFKLVTNKKVQLLGDLYDFPKKTMSIGRLDKDSEGLLFLTTNGKASALITGRKIEKEYYVQVDGIITPKAIQQMEQGVEISIKGEKYTTLPCIAARLYTPPTFPPRTKRLRDDRHGPTSWVAITIREGKFRQVRKMTAVVGFPTLRLIRVRIGKEWLGDLKAGEVREVDSFKLGFLKL